MKRGAPLQRRTPMSRGSGFKAKAKPWPRPVDTDSANEPVFRELPKLERKPNYAPPTFKQAEPKTVAHRNRRLLDLARDKPCLLCIDGVCNADTSTTAAAHSNWSDLGGKSGARKASDEYSVWACSACHIPWLDQGMAATRDQKREAFIAAMRKQIVWWFDLARDTAQMHADRQACRWALELLSADERFPEAKEFFEKVLL